MFTKNNTIHKIFIQCSAVMHMCMCREFPHIYRLPQFPDYIQQALDRREQVCREDHYRKLIVRVLFDDLLQFGVFV